MFDFGLYTQVSDSGPQGPLVLLLPCKLPRLGKFDVCSQQTVLKKSEYKKAQKKEYKDQSNLYMKGETSHKVTLFLPELGLVEIQTERVRFPLPHELAMSNYFSLICNQLI